MSESNPQSPSILGLMIFELSPRPSSARANSLCGAYDGRGTAELQLHGDV